MLLILSVLAVFAAAAAYAFMYNDAMQKAREEAAVQKEVVAASKHTVDAENMKAAYGRTAADRALLPSFLVPQNDAVPFINTVEAVGPASGTKVSLSSLSSGAGPNPLYGTVTATISIVGTWANVMRAVEMIENMQYAISVKDVHLDLLSSSGPSPKSAPNWTASMDISALSST